ncbi:MAG: geranylgeranyl reductase family protein [Syntrophothermus sp.]
MIVVGGGPAGATAARWCARFGLETLLLDKAYFPRPKPCGGGVTEAALSLLDFQIPKELVERDGVRLRPFYKDRSIELSRAERFIALISRENFDHFLLRKAKEAGAEIREGQRVIAVETDGKRAMVGTTDGKFAGRILIGADGVNSVVARLVRPPLTANRMALCLAAEIPASEAEISSRIKDGIEIHYGIPTMGYGWIFPKRSHFSVGIGALASHLADPRRILNEFVEKNGLPRQYHAVGHFIPVGGIPRKTVADRILLVGDAAGFADPFTGEGIRYAIASGRLAAETARDVLLSRRIAPTRENLTAYRRQTVEAFEWDLRAALLLAYSFFYLTGPMHRVFFKNPAAFGKLLDVVHGKATYRQLLRWLLLRLPYYSVRAGLPRRSAPEKAGI